MPPEGQRLLSLPSLEIHLIPPHRSNPDSKAAGWSKLQPAAKFLDSVGSLRNVVDFNHPNRGHASDVFNPG